MTEVMIHVAGAVSLLLWGCYTIRSSVERTFSGFLQSAVSRAANSLPASVATGCLAALGMQSATATILLTTSLLSSGIIPLVSAMGVVLGADLGSAIAARILFLDLSLLPPVILVVGIVTHLLAATARGRELGRIVVGFGLVFLAIQLLKVAVSPLTGAPLSQAWLSVLGSIPWISLIVVAITVWLVHSSVAVVLVIASLAQAQIIPTELFVPMVLGANVGAGLIALPLVDRRDPRSRSVVIANLAGRSAICLAGLLTIPWWLGYLQDLVSAAGLQVIWLHIAINSLVVLTFAPFAETLVRKLKDNLVARDQGRGEAVGVSVGSGLDYDSVKDPKVAISNARREAFRLGDITEALFSRSLDMFSARDQSQIDQLVETDREINARNKAIQKYLADARRYVSSDDLEAELDTVLQFASTMENVGDTVSHGLSRLASKRLGRQVDFSDEGMREIHGIHGEVLSLMRYMIQQFDSGKLVRTRDQKKQVRHIRRLCESSMASHRQRLSENRLSSIGSSSIHQDTVRDFLLVALLLDSASTQSS